MNEDIETQHAIMGETTVFSDQERSSSWKTVALSGVKGAVLGVMILLGILGICAVMEFESGDGFAGWAGLQGHQLLAKPGMNRLIEEYGDAAEYNAPGYVQSTYVLAHLIRIGLLLGVLAGLVVGLARFLPEYRENGGVALSAGVGALAGVLTGLVLIPQPKFLAFGLVTGATASTVLSLIFKRRPASAEDKEPSSSLPAAFPLGVALVGLFWHGFVWGNAAIFCLPVSRKRKLWLTGVTWVVAFLAVSLWAWGLETTWEDGWSEQLPHNVKNFIYWIGSLVGMKE